MYGHVTDAYTRTDPRRLAQTGRFRFSATEKRSGVLPPTELEHHVRREAGARTSMPPPNTQHPWSWGPTRNLVGARNRVVAWGVELLPLRARGASEDVRVRGDHPGTLYQTLRRMEKAGNVKSSWQTPKGSPALRTCATTVSGEVHLGVWAKPVIDTSIAWRTSSNSVW